MAQMVRVMVSGDISGERGGGELGNEAEIDLPALQELVANYERPVGVGRPKGT